MTIGNVQEARLKSNIDAFSHSATIAQLELLLTYAERFYHRQFITRRAANHQLLPGLKDFFAIISTTMI